MSLPFIKFYPRDWRGDQALRAVSIAARGLWMECLCIMHEAKPYGHLVLNGEPVEGDTLARMTGVPVEEVSALMTELRKAGVLSVTGKGIVFSRRMTKDHARAQKGRLSAKKRWQQASDGVEQSEAPNRYPIKGPITQKPEARSQKTKYRSNGHDPPAEPEGFTEFWAVYPRKVAKRTAEKAYQQALARASPDAILAGAKRFSAVMATGDPKYVKHPATWLNGDCWADEDASTVQEDDEWKRLRLL